MKRIAAAAFAAALVAQILGPFAFAVDGNQGMCDYAAIDCTTGQVFDSKTPPTTVVQGSQTAILTGHGTVTLTSVATHTHTVTDISGTETYTHTHTVTQVGGAVADTDPRLTDARASTNTLYCAGGLIFAASVHDTATGTGTGSRTVTGSDTSTGSSTVTNSWTYAGSGTRTFLATTTATTTETLTQAFLLTATFSRTRTSTGTLTYSGTISGTGTATGTNTGTGTIAGTGTGSGNVTQTHTYSGTSIDVKTFTWSNTTTHSATGTVTITMTYSSTATNTVTVDITSTATGTGTITGTGTGTWTNTTTHTVTGTSARISDNPTVSDTKTNTHVLGVPRGANKTLNATGTTVLASTDFATSSPIPSAIPLAGTDSRLDIGWLPTGTATDSVVTGADPRLTDARASTNTVYQGTTNVSFSTGTSTTTATSAAVADNPKIHVAMSTGNLVGTLTANYVPKATGTSTLANSRIYDNGTYAGVGMGTSVAAEWHVNGKAKSTYLDPGYVTTDLLPDGTGKNVGSATYPWQDGRFSRNVYVGSDIIGPSLGNLYIGVPPSTNMTLDYNGNVAVSGSITAGNITATAGGSKIPVADANGKLNTWIGDSRGDLNDKMRVVHVTNTAASTATNTSTYTTVLSFTDTTNFENTSRSYLVSYGATGTVDNEVSCFLNVTIGGTIIGGDVRVSSPASGYYWNAFKTVRLSANLYNATVALVMRSNSAGRACIILNSGGFGDAWVTVAQVKPM